MNGLWLTALLVLLAVFYWGIRPDLQNVKRHAEYQRRSRARQNAQE